MIDYGGSARYYHLRKAVVYLAARAVGLHPVAPVNNESGERGDVEQPAAVNHKVVAVASADGNLCKMDVEGL